MKKFLVVLALLFAQKPSFAQTLLKVSLADKEVINVAVDGRYFNKSGTSVTVGDLPRGRHTLQIYAMVQASDGSMNQERVYEGRIRTYDGIITIFVLDPATGGASIEQQDINNYVADHPLPPGAPGSPATGNDNGDNNENSENPDNSPVASPVNVPATGTFTQSKSDSLKAIIAAKKTDTEKMTAIRQGLQNETVTTAQVSDMMDWFNFEDSRLDFSKWAYNITVDKDNYDTLINKFSYKNYQDDFSKFMQDKK